MCRLGLERTLAEWKAWTVRVRWSRPLLFCALLLNLGATLSATWVDPPLNDMLLHGQMTETARDSLVEDGWAAFQDPWFPHINGGYALFRVYPHLAHQTTAFLAALLGVDPWSMMAFCAAALVAMLPLLTYAGGRILGLAPRLAALSAYVVATLRCADGYGHFALGYGSGSHGLYAQLWGTAIATLALPAWIAASREHRGDRWLRWARVALAAALVSLVVRSHLPAAWVLPIVAGLVVVGEATPRQIPRRVGRLFIVGLAGLALSSTFLGPFFANLPDVHDTSLDFDWKIRSVGAGAVLNHLARGDYLDGSMPGPWTLGLAIGAVLVLADVARRRSGHPLLRGCLLAAIGAVLLLFGRFTWGDWLNHVPVVSRFHDHRYLLGLHLVAPWLVALSYGELIARAGRRSRRSLVPSLVAAGIAVACILAGALQIAAFCENARDYVQARDDHANWIGSIDELTATLARTRGETIALARADEPVGGTTLLSWLRRQGFKTFGRPLYHYSFSTDFSVFWTVWMDPGSSEHTGPPTPEDLLAAGVTMLVVPREDEAPRDATSNWTRLQTEPEGSGWQLLRPAGSHTDVALVRSDLLLYSESCNLDGVAIAWFQTRTHQIGQYPTVVLGTGAPPTPRSYLRSAKVSDRDVAVFADLPRAPLGSLGTIVDDRATSEGRKIRARVDAPGSWLLVTTGWHPDWCCTVDGQAAPIAMLLPGWLGIPLDPGDHEITLQWPVSRARGRLALLSLLLMIGTLGISLTKIALHRRSNDIVDPK